MRPGGPKQVNLLSGLIALLLLGGCVSDPGNRRTSGLRGDGTVTGTPVPSDFNLDKPPVYWFNGNAITPGEVEVNSNSATVLYIRGTVVENFLAFDDNDEKVFCLVANSDQQSLGALPHFRARAVPFTFRDTTQDPLTVEKMFRVDITDETAGTTFCSGTAEGITTAQSAFDLNDVCTTCGDTLVHSQIQMFLSNTLVIASTPINQTALNLGTLGLKTDLTLLPPGVVNPCEDSTCVAQGKDCCIESICVDNGQQRPGADLQPDFLQSQIEIASNISTIVNYKHLYFVCENLPLPTPTATATPDHSGDAQELLVLRGQQVDCLADVNTCAGNGLVQSEVQTEVWNVCGCLAANPAIECAGWTFTPITNDTGAIVRYECLSPTPTPIQKFQVLGLPVSGRNVPHRFFRSTDGVAIDDISTLTASTAAAGTVNEGDQFSYEITIPSKINPQNVSFNMNAILGQMEITLSNARPAVVVDLPDNRVPIIISSNQNSGTFTACPDCTKSNWNNDLSAFPEAFDGTGLRAVGFETNREATGLNVTGGNYEDTIFGRACWVPPTMIGFSHQADADVQTQRQNRLQTQAALFMNGYQRDWYGFNLGAVIGSFDGVQWFAVGQGRFITPRSNKLFLAINSPLADLAEDTATTVNIIEYQGEDEEFTEHDWNFDPAFPDRLNNQGATCRDWHSCNTDTDCITKLGWEYMCGSINQYRTQWPEFSNVDEQAASSVTRIGSQIPVNGITGGTKRCVYRGAGAICKTNYLNLPEAQRRLFTCAPNFHCAAIDSEVFNAQIARTPIINEITRFGQDSDVPGRPLHYQISTSSLPAVVISNLQSNASNQHVSFTNDGDLGLCRPGKKLDEVTPILQHSSPDTGLRSDFISQIAPCDATASDTTTTFSRTQTCPVIEPVTLNYTYVDIGTHSLPASRSQNACGAESRDLASGVSSFDQFEAGPLVTTSETILTRKLAQNACLRRAGAVCHSDLDCFPNRLHEEAVQGLDAAHFGLGAAELQFFKEPLICGQKDPKPISQNSSNITTYDMTQNRCCRAIGDTLTMSTAGDTEERTNNDNFVRHTADDQSVLNASLPGRYSRYSGVLNLGDASTDPDPYFEVPMVDINDMANASIPNKFQWKTIGAAGAQGCCGGGWIRQFADESGHDWTVNNRLEVQFDNFQCLNYANDLVLEKQDQTNQQVYATEFSKFCTDPVGGNCFQQTFTSSTDFSVVSPRNNTVIESNDLGIDFTTEDNFTNIRTAIFPYRPDVVIPPANGSTIIPCDEIGPPEFDDDRTGTVISWDPGTSIGCFFMPSYINGVANILQVDFLFDINNDGTINVAGGDGECTSINQSPAKGSGGGCEANATAIIAGNEVDFSWNIIDGDKFVYGIDRSVSAFNIPSRAYVRIRFLPVGTPNYRPAGGVIANFVVDDTIGTDAANSDSDFLDNRDSSDSPRSMSPGNDLYYLQRLGRFELLGVPQVHYDPLYCNSNKSRLVPGLYSNGMTTRDDFQTAGNSYQNPNATDIFDSANPNTIDIDPDPLITNIASLGPLVTSKERIVLPEVFDSEKFVCCLYLGEQFSSNLDDSRCCTSFTISTQDADGNQVKECALPAGANLNVYFNRFITSDGVGPNQPAGGFEDTDFDPFTGEVNLNVGSYTILREMGIRYCSNQAVITGGAFGEFNNTPEDGNDPNATSAPIFGILDEGTDIQPTITPTTGVPTPNPNVERGAIQFANGFKWNHHFYCAP